MTESPATDAGSAPDDLGTILRSERTAQELLRRVVDMAAFTVTGVDAASVTLATSAAPGYWTASATDDSALAVDQAQYRSGYGPCVQAAATATDVVVSVPADGWEDFSAAAGTAGYRSVWSMALQMEGRPAGSLNLYSCAAAPWDDNSSRTVRMIGSQAEVVLTNAMELARSEHVNVTLQRALETRTVIGQAQGVLMARQNITAQEAFDILRRASQRTNRKLRDIAADIVASVTDPAVENPDL